MAYTVLSTVNLWHYMHLIHSVLLVMPIDGKLYRQGNIMIKWQNKLHKCFKTNKILYLTQNEVKHAADINKFKCQAEVFNYVYIYKLKMSQRSLPDATQIFHSKIVSCVLHSARPKEFSATTLYSPLSLAPTLKISMEHTPQVLVM